eukprot:NODE_338_length_1862_cov_94.471042_g244_i0.p1 GENE.NODE_338_length_1862_cov_94.471042_g244_i0~~NODE_338_length_1862_cov_94.471042_g244_i0.p1  ORF type:complete len:542 (+),score=196.43 NODE_338_length_1862_cov_94.471042_g244_i0:65-1690(+)
MARFLQNNLSGMMKDGMRVSDDPVLKNITACKEIVRITRSSLGPDGLNKLVINHLGKMCVTHDAATIMKELEVEHPAAKLVVMSAKAMEEEIGDGTNYVLIMAGELLNQAQQLIHMGIHPSHIISGYIKSSEVALDLLGESSELVCKKVLDVRNAPEVELAITTAIGSKQPQHKAHLARLVAGACIGVCPTNPKSFNVDNVRVAKIEGANVGGSTLLHGFAIARDSEGTIKEVVKGKVAVYNCAIDNAATDTKGKVDIRTAEELKDFSKTEETTMDRVIGAIAATGVKVLVSTQSFGDLAMHYIEHYQMMAVKVQSKFEIRRLTAAVNAQQIMTLDPPTPEELGRCDLVKVEEIGSQKIVVFRQEHESSKLATIVIRGPTKNILDDVERAIDDGVNCYKSLCANPGLVPGGGACEIELSRRLTKLAEETAEVHQYAMRRYAQAFDIIPTTLAEVSGHNATNVITQLMADHQAGKVNHGIDLEDGSSLDMLEAGVLDLAATKYWAIKFATDAAITVLKVDQIIMAKPAGGPKARDAGPGDED